MMSVMTGCGIKPVTTAVEVAERYLTSDRYENYHMDGFITVTTTFLSDFDKLFSDVSVVYTFDKNYNLTSISCDCVEINSIVAKDDTSYDLTNTHGQARGVA